MTLTEFLLARIAEDEFDAKRILGRFAVPEWTAYPDEVGQPVKSGGIRVLTGAETVLPHVARHDPARVLAECEAKRRIVEAHEPYESEQHGGMACWTCGPGGFPYPCTTLRVLAAIFADHPDYRDEWKLAD